MSNFGNVPGAPGGPPPGGYGLGGPPGAGDPQLAAMKRKIDGMQKLYFVLFFTSLALVVASWTMRLPGFGHLLWALSLGGAVVVRLMRQSLVQKYNAAIMGGRAPIQ